nr:hypothetical protein [Streptomyces sp. 142MFCol3.1]
MFAVAVYGTERSVRRAETGWSKARRLNGKRIRTCEPAVVKRQAPGGTHSGTESNIVRGED